jgi:biopolymer transport protein ExbD
LTIDADGSLRYNGQPLALEALQPLLESLAAEADAPTLYVSLAREGSADRGPVVWDLLQRVQRAEVKNVVFVGPPTPPEPSSENP